MRRFHLIFALGCIALAAGCAANQDRVGDGGAVGGDGATKPSADGETPDGGLADGDIRSDGGRCDDACTEGETRCSGIEVQRCEIDSASGCTVWTDPAECPGEDVCSKDECRDECEDACTEGDRRCASDDGFQTCALQESGCLEWDPEEGCPEEEVCGEDGSCRACTDGSRRCGPTGSVQECVSGSWTDVESCAFGCDSGSCDRMVACTPGTYRCRGDNVETCNSSGTAWLHVRTCAVSCESGLCTGACTPGQTRCNGDMVETCDEEGTGWDATESCDTFCARGGCALDGLELTTNTTLDGEVLVDGDVVVRSGVTVTASTGQLTLRADSITVENGASISVAPTGESPDGQGRGGRYISAGCYCYTGGSGGGYGSRGDDPYSGSGRGGATWGSETDAAVRPGSPGGKGHSEDGGEGGLGGGMLRLIADQITLAGQLTANGADGETGSYSNGGGGSGGGILLAGDDVTVTGTISASGGSGAGSGRSGGGDGGDGRVKILYGGSLDDDEGSIGGAVTRGLLPPLELSSSTHPDPDLVYNDGFDVVAVSWRRPFSPLTGYYWLHDTSERVPDPSNADFVETELVSFPVEELVEGTNLFQVVSVNPMADVGTVAGRLAIWLNRTPPTLSSSSHPSSTTWSSNPDVFMSWSFPHEDGNYQGVHYVFDRYGDTVPTKGDTFVPVDQKQILLSSVEDGVWGFHVVSVDGQGYLTREAGHYRVRIGDDPGAGNVFGQITDSTTSEPIAGAEVDINRGLFPTAMTNDTGNFNMADIPVGEWELRVRADGYDTETRTITVEEEMGTGSNVSLSPAE